MSSKNRLRRRGRIFVVGAFLITASFAYLAYSLFYNVGNVILSLDLPENVVVGVPVKAAVVFQNNSRNSFRDVSLALVLPAGINFADKSESSRRIEEKGFVDPGKTVREEFDILIESKLSAGREIRAEAFYTPENLGQKLLISEVRRIEIKDPIDLSISAPDFIFAGEEFEWGVVLKNSSERDWRAVLVADFPEGVADDIEKRTIIPAGAEQRLVFLTKALLEENSQEEVAVRIYDEDKGGLTGGTIAGESFFLRAARPSLQTSLRVNDEVSAIAFPGGELQYVLTLRNNSSLPLADVAATVLLDGQMFDFTTLSSTGRIFSGGARVVWDSGADRGLLRLDPREEIALAFTVRVKGEYPIVSFNDKNFELKVEAKAEALSGGVKNVISIARLNTKVAGEINLSARALYRDATAGFINDGPFPPKVGVTTEYVVRWKISAYGSDMDNVVVSAELPAGARLTGKKKITVGELAEEKGRVTWKLPKLFSGTGILSAPPEVVFQVAFTPSEEDAGREAVLIKEALASANDSFIGSSFETLLPAKTTRLEDDGTVGSGEGVVAR